MSETWTRPNGKLYKPRKPPVVLMLHDSDDWEYPVVIRTHDVALAVEMIGASLADEYGVNIDAPITGWFRLSIRDGDPWWIDDPIRGVPHVWFEEVR